MYFTGDGAKRDADGYYWITGRVDDVLNVSGHRIGTAEVESALVGHEHVTEAAVVGVPHDIKGQGIYCYVTLASGVAPSEAIVADLKAQVRKVIGPIATPSESSCNIVEAIFAVCSAGIISTLAVSDRRQNG